MAIVKPVRKPESDHVRGYRRTVEDTGRDQGISVNSRSLESIVHPNTLPMRTVIECPPSRTQKGKQPRYPGMLSSPCNFKVTKTRASAQEMHDAAQHSQQVEGGWNYGNRTLKHPAFTSRRRRNDQELED